MRVGGPLWGFLIDRVDHRIAVSERARASQERWLPGEYEVIPNGVLVPDDAPAGDREHRIVFAGRHEPRKGLQVLLRAWPDIRRETGLRLTVAGADPLAVRLLLTRLRVPDDGIDVVGFLSQDELTETLLGAKALVAPSLGQESFGMVLTRAFACSLPAVASDIPGYREVLAQTAYQIVTSAPTQPLAITSLMSNLASPQAAGTTVTFSTVASGGSGAYEFKWWIFDGTTWKVGQNWSSNSTFNWRPGARGTYIVAVWARNAGVKIDASQALGQVTYIVN